ncbi:hypothetical protein ACN4EG_06960 [Alkalinema pantanalense CENA528]|uniref:hypothetical protein n=1 Tax=Alkalinema pantanalense TaxID=1620705 RepID=UPI003D6FE47D
MINPKKLLPLTLFVLLGACSANPTKASDSTANNVPGKDSAQNSAKTTQLADASRAGNDRSQPIPTVCARDDGRGFVSDFIRQQVVRDAYTANEVEIRDYDNPDLIIETISKDRYDDFRIGQIDMSYVYRDAATRNLSPEEQLKTRVKTDFRQVDRNTFRVDYVKAEWVDDGEEGSFGRTYGAPGAYIFEHRNGCWQLTQELRSTSQADSQATSQANSAPTSSSNTQSDLQAILYKNMPYADLRSTVLQQGWTPLPSPDCKENVGGAATVCDEIPEMNSCSGDGYCLMYFEDRSSGKKMSVTTYGPYRAWNATDSREKAALGVVNWGIK